MAGPEEFSPDALKAARRRLGHNQEEAARAMTFGLAKVSVSAVQKWERGVRTPKNLYLARVLRYIKGSKTRKPPRRD